MGSHSIAYDRGNMFYCQTCGLWCSIRIDAKDVGLADFQVAARDKGVYETRFDCFPCIPNRAELSDPNLMPYDGEVREEAKQIKKI